MSCLIHIPLLVTTFVTLSAFVILQKSQNVFKSKQREITKCQQVVQTSKEYLQDAKKMLHAAQQAFVALECLRPSWCTADKFLLHRISESVDAN